MPTLSIADGWRILQILYIAIRFTTHSPLKSRIVKVTPSGVAIELIFIQGLVLSSQPRNMDGGQRRETSYVADTQERASLKFAPDERTILNMGGLTLSFPYRNACSINASGYLLSLTIRHSRIGGTELTAGEVRAVVGGDNGECPNTALHWMELGNLYIVDFQQSTYLKIAQVSSPRKREHMQYGPASSLLPLQATKRGDVYIVGLYGSSKQSYRYGQTRSVEFR